MKRNFSFWYLKLAEAVFGVSNNPEFIFHIPEQIVALGLNQSDPPTVYSVRIS